MIGQIRRYGLPFANVAASAVATASITPGRTIECITLELGGTTFTKALITKIQVKANGKTFYEGSATQIAKLNAYKGVVAGTTFLDIDFTEPMGKTVIDRMVGAFDTSDVQNITIEVTIGAATAPTLKMILVESGLQRDRQGNKAAHSPIMHKVLSYPFAQGVGGTLPVTLPFGPQNGAIIKRVHIENAGGLMTGLTVKQDGMVIHESTVAENSYTQSRLGLVPQTVLYTADFVTDGEMDKALDTRDCRSLEWLLTFSGADSGTIFVEYLDVLGNL